MMIKTIERLVSERPFNHRFSHCEANRVETEYLDKKIDHSLKVPMEPTLCSFLGFDFGGTKKMRPADWTHRKKMMMSIPLLAELKPMFKKSQHQRVMLWKMSLLFQMVMFQVAMLS